MRTRKRSAVVLVVALLLLATALPGAGGEHRLAAAPDQVWLVELSGRPLIEVEQGMRPDQIQQHLAGLGREQEQVRAAARRAGIGFDERHSYRRVFNGLALQLSAADAQKLHALPGVTAVYPSLVFEVPDLGTSLDMIDAPAIDSGYDGSGVLVAVIDTGIDYTHPDLGGCVAIGPGCRVRGGWDFVGDDFDARSPDPQRRIPMPGPDPQDPHGHGTHVAGIIGADGGVRGVAPGVDFLALKVFGRSGSSTADIILASLEMAHALGADVINMSLGASFQWPQYPTSRASDRLVDRGIVVVASAGNSGAYGLYAGGAPALGQKVLSVASVNNTHSLARLFRLPDGTEMGYVPMVYSGPIPTEGVSPTLVHVGMGNDPDDYRDEHGNSRVAGKTALIERGLAPFSDKVSLAMAAGAEVAVIYNNVPGSFAGTLQFPDIDWIPALSISREDGLAILARMEHDAVALTWTDEQRSLPDPTGGQTSSFSSWGPAPDLTLKPDIAAPGGNIRSLEPGGGYRSSSGTSMSAPHVAGAAALMRQAHPRISAAAVQSLLMNTARPYVYATTPFLEPVHRQGAGMVDVLAALHAEVAIKPAKLSLGAVAPGAGVSRPLVIENLTDRPVTWEIVHREAIATSGDGGLYLVAADVSAPSSVSLPAGGVRRINVQIGVPAGLPEGFLLSGYLELRRPAAHAPAAALPYLIFAGDYPDWAAERLLMPGNYDFPWLAELDAEGYFVRHEAMTIRPADGELAWVLVNLGHQARKMRLEVFAADTGRAYGRVWNEDYVRRSADGDDFLALFWDGSDRRGRPVPAGEYVLKLSVQAALGDDNNPDHWREWMSGVVTVQR